MGSTVRTERTGVIACITCTSTCCIRVKSWEVMKIDRGLDFHHLPAFYSYATCGGTGDAGDDASALCADSAAHWDGPLLGLASCPCVGWYDRTGTIKLSVTPGGAKINYPAMTGGECMKR